ncbi:MAG: SGNH/GDSL hydrolase family protein [Planctomycetota bacterium]
MGKEMAGTTTRGAVRKRILLLVGSTVFTLSLVESCLRLTTTPSSFRNPDSDAYWILRVRESSPEQRRFAEDVSYDPQLGWRSKPNFVNGSIHHNSRGVRGQREHAEAKADGTQRILALGDSYTYGLLVADNATYAARLESLLPATEVLNLGVNGYGTDQQTLLWELEGARYRPDLVLLGFFLHDFHRNGQSVFQYPKPYFVADPVAVGGFRLSGVPVAPLESLLDNTEFAVAPSIRLVDASRFAMSRIQRRSGWFEPERAYRQKVALTKFLLERLNASVRASGAKLVVLVLPPEQAQAFPDALFIENTIVESCVRLSIPVHSLSEFFALRSSRGEQLHEHAHWNARGHELAAEEIARYLRSEGLVAESTNPRKDK